MQSVLVIGNWVLDIVWDLLFGICDFYFLFSSIHVLPSVDLIIRPGDKGSLFAGQEAHQVSHLIRAPQSTYRDIGHDLVAILLGHRHDHIRADITR